MEAFRAGKSIVVDVLHYGYDESAVYTARMALMEGAYPNEEARRQFFVRAVRTLRQNSHFDGAALQVNGCCRDRHDLNM